MFVNSVLQAAGSYFLALGPCFLVGEAGLEACTVFLVGGVSVCPLVDGAGWWPSGG